MRLLGIDPGLRVTGWGVIQFDDNKLSHIANGCISSEKNRAMSERLLQLSEGLEEVIQCYKPKEAAVEETFVNKNASSTLKLGQARGVAILAPAKFAIPVAEYSPNFIKKSLVGAGHAAKEQVQMMVNSLLPGCSVATIDASDALAVAICHAHHRVSSKMLNQI